MSLGLNPGDLATITIRGARICPTHPDAHGRLTIAYRIADNTWATLHIATHAESVTVRPAPLIPPPVDPDEQYHRDMAVASRLLADRNEAIARLQDRITDLEHELAVALDARDQALYEADRRDAQPIRRAS